MAEQASSFVRDWIASNIRNDPARWDARLDDWAADEVEKLRAAAKTAGLDLSDPELDGDVLHDEIAAAIENIYDRDAGGIKY
ncbi:hypothetical protein FV222_02780 [Methylobacterium sp. WL103]|uniref:hypothetical protein n=1 Tax=Methylobacterium TaxID=407 RepID=UPI0011CB9402|nr:MULTISPECIES: hypothetical protein [Methylobacterium]TXM70179.1 hypothetical protein FV229_03160 [Methylobacterium sp. WL120]TXN07293.1 hypothetical protein FV222_02780 [Methylobacterium sp. WL103]TXN13785.1 hypothetical protein FV219_04485 [Methylobacterium sp. WL122]